MAPGLQQMMPWHDFLLHALVPRALGHRNPEVSLLQQELHGNYSEKVHSKICRPHESLKHGQASHDRAAKIT